MDFTTPANSLLVKYRLAEIDRDYGFYRKGRVWADPDLEHAAESLLYLYENRNKAQQIGSRAKQDILQQFHPKDVGKQTLERLQKITSVRILPWHRSQEIGLAPQYTSWRL